MHLKPTLVKFIYSEKATNIEKKYLKKLMFQTKLVVFFPNFVAFSKYMMSHNIGMEEIILCLCLFYFNLKNSK